MQDVKLTVIKTAALYRSNNVVEVGYMATPTCQIKRLYSVLCMGNIWIAPDSQGSLRLSANRATGIAIVDDQPR